MFRRRTGAISFGSVGTLKVLGLGLFLSLVLNLFQRSTSQNLKLELDHLELQNRTLEAITSDLRADTSRLGRLYQEALEDVSKVRLRASESILELEDALEDLKQKEQQEQPVHGESCGNTVKKSWGAENIPLEIQGILQEIHQELHQELHREI